MSLTQQYQHLFAEVEQMADHLHDLSRFTRRRADDQRTALDTVASLNRALNDGDQAALHGAFARAAQASLTHEVARGRYRLQNMHTTADLLWSSGTQLHGVVGELRGPVLWALELVPSPILDFLADHLGIRLPSLEQILQHGAACMPSLAGHWQWNAGAAMDFLQGISGLLPALGGAAEVQQQHANGHVALGPVDHHALLAATQVQQVHTAARAQVDAKGTSTLGNDDNTYGKPLPPPDTQAHIDERVRLLHALLHDPNITEDARGKYAAQYLQGLDIDKIQQMDSSYTRQYKGTALENDLFGRVKSSVWRYKLTQMLFPEQVQTTQANPIALGSGNDYSHIEMAPPNGTIPFSAGATAYDKRQRTDAIKFVFVPGKDRGKPKEIHSFVIPDGQKEYDTQNGSSTSRAFYGTGDYTVVFEVVYADGPPVYYSHVQHVATAQDIALNAVQNMAPAPNPAILLMFYNAMLQSTKDDTSKQNIQAMIDKIKHSFSDSVGPPIPLQVSYVPEMSVSGVPTTIPLQLYAKKVATEFPGAFTWEIVDLTSPGNQVYAGGSLQDAWNNFVQRSGYPIGAMALSTPQLPGVPSTIVSSKHIPAHESNPNDWATLIPLLKSVGLPGILLGIAGSFVDPFLGAAIFTLAGLSVAAGSALDLYLRWYNNTLALDQGSAWDLFSIAAGVVGVGALGLSVTDVAGSAVATSASATSKMVMITGVGGLALGGAQGVLVTWDTYVAIQNVLKSNESNGDKARDIAIILGEAGAQSALIILGIRGQWNAVNALHSIDSMRAGGVNDDLLTTLAQVKDQGALDTIQTFLKAGSADGTYSPDRITAINKATNEYQRLLSLNKLPALGSSDYISLTDYLTRAYEAQPGSGIWLNALQIIQARQAAATAAGKLSPDLITLIETDPQMQGIIANKNFVLTDDVAQDMQKAWEKWRKAPGTNTFAEYLNAIKRSNSGITYPMLFGKGERPLGVVIPSLDSMTGNQRQLAFLKAFTPASDTKGLIRVITDDNGNVSYAFNTTLSSDAQTFVKNIVSKLDISANSSALESGVRSQFSQQFNKQMAADLIQLYQKDPEQALKLYREITPYLADASKGGITKDFLFAVLQPHTPDLQLEGNFPPYTMDDQDLAIFNEIYLRDPNALSAAEKTRFEKIRDSIFATTSTGRDPQVRPDLLSGDGKVLVDIKAGYVTGNIDPAQIIAYLLKIKRGEKLEHAVYLFGPGAKAGDAEQAALASFATIKNIIPEDDLGYFSVYYMDENGQIFVVKSVKPIVVELVPANQLGQILAVPPKP